jgi:hypothetical protein
MRAMNRPSGDSDPLLSVAENVAANNPGTAVLVLDRDMRIRGANGAYEAISLQRTADIIGEFLFDVFTEDPADDQANGTVKVHESIEHALSRRASHSLPIYRYDICDPRNSDRYMSRLWSSTHTSIHDGVDQYGVVELVTPVTTFHGAIAALSTALASGESIGSAEQLHLLSGLADSMRTQHDQVAALNVQADQLFRAIETRDIIGQAKGMIMERYNISADQAFQLLKRLSQASNTKLVHVARQLVEAEHPNNTGAD